MAHREVLLWFVASAIWLFIAIRRIVRHEVPMLGWFLLVVYVPVLVFWVQRYLKS